jgi:hypothetical protein
MIYMLLIALIILYIPDLYWFFVAVHSVLILQPRPSLSQHSENPWARLNAWPSSDHHHVQAVDKGVSSAGLQFPLLPEWGAGAGRDAWQQTEAG